MLNTISKFIESPEDKDPSFFRIVRNILIFAIFATVLSIGALITQPDQSGHSTTIVVLIASGILEVVALLLALRGSLIFARLVVPIVLIIAVTISAVRGNTIHDISVIAYPLIVLVAAVLQGKRFLLANTIIAGGAIALLGILDLTGTSKSPLASSTTIGTIIIGVVLLSTGTAAINLLIGRLSLAITNAEANERAQVEANLELKKLQISLEQRVQDRTSELLQRGTELENASKQIQTRAAQFEALAQVTQTITSIRDLGDLLPRIATVISEKFRFYHVGVFLLDEVNEYAMLSATNSEGGRKMMERKHRLRVGAQGIVGNVTLTGNPRVAMDVGSDAVFFNNPELPETHSEMALPLKTGELIIGALDVQSTERGAFTDEDIQMLSLLANQVSLAIENARLFEETRKALAESEATSRQTTREAWRNLPVEQNLLGYRYTLTGASPLDKPVALTEPGGAKKTETARIVVPIELRGETIGTLVVQSPSTGEISQDQIDLIKAVAERVAISAENARLFDETTRRAERERMVSDITGKIRSVNDPQTMIQTAIEELRNALGASRVEVIPQTIKGAE